MKLTKTGSQARRSESHTRSPEGDKGAVGGCRGGISARWPGGVSVWPLTALATLRGSFPGTVQGLVMNCSYGSSDSAPREASVPGLSLVQLPLKIPTTGSSLPPRVCEPNHQQPTPSSPSMSSDNRAGRALVAPGGGRGSDHHPSVSQGCHSCSLWKTSTLFQDTQ